MILVVFVALSAATVPLARGRLVRLAALRFRWAWLIPLAIGLQVLITVAMPGPRDILRDSLHILSYGAAVVFLVANRRIPGMWLIGVGAAMNVTAILANGGVMPASPHALALAGLPTTSMGFQNSMQLASPHLAFLGDIFAIPKSLPLSNVFSAGDICVALGAALTIHRVSGSALLPSGRGQFAPLLHKPTFMRLWGSQAVSNMGDWTYAIAVAFTVAARTHSPQLLATLLIVQVAPAAIFGGLMGSLVDRYSRVKLMIGADVIRALAVGSLLLGTPSNGHLFVVAAILGTFGSLFQPSLQASIPNVVEKGQVVAANSMVGATFHFAIMAGPALGGLLVAKLGVIPVFAMNACSFLISAILITGIRLPKPDPSRSNVGSARTALRDLVEGARYSLRTPLVRGLLIVVGMVLVAAASKAPLESLFVLRALSLGPQALGLVLGCWGLGMLLGSVAAPALCRKWARERIMVVTIGVVGLSVLIASQAHDLQTVLLAWLLAGSANSVANVSYESMLQERTPDEFRGRVFAAFEFVTNLGYLMGAFLAGWLGTRLGLRSSYVFSGGLFVAAALVARAVLQRGRAGKPMLVGFEPGAARPSPRPVRAEAETMPMPAAPAAPVPSTDVVPAPSLVAGTGFATPAVAAAGQRVFAPSNSIFSGTESVFAMAERESGFDEEMPDSPFGRNFVPSAVDEPAEETEAEIEPLVFPVQHFVDAEPAAFEATPIEPELEDSWPAPDLGDLSDLDEDSEEEELEVDEEQPYEVAETGEIAAPVELAAPTEVREPTDVQEPVVDEPLAVEVPDDPSELITSFDPADRLRAVELAAASMEDPIVATILKALADPAPQVRRRAAQEVGRLRITDALPALDHTVDDPDDSVRMAAVEALAELAGDDALAAIIRALGDPSEDVRRAATSALVINGSENVVRLLCGALASYVLRSAALEALSQIGTVAVDPMVDMLSGANGLRPALGAALARVAGPSRFAEDLSMLDPAIRRRAVEALGAIGGPDAVTELVRALVDPEPDVRTRAAELLGELGDPSAHDDLERTTYDPVPEVGDAARRALAELQSAEPALA